MEKLKITTFRWAVRGWWLLKLVLMISVIWLIWVASVYLFSYSEFWAIPDLGDKATILFGASSVALFIFSIIIALLAAIGWQTAMNAVRETARETTKEAISPLENELRGRVLSSLGYMIGELSLRTDLKPADPDRLAEAVDLCQKGYGYLKKMGGPAEYLGLNNLVFYSALEGNTSRSDFLLKGARRLMEAGQEHNATNLQLTACRVILWYSEDEGEKKKAFKVLKELAEKSPSRRERREARTYLASLPEPEL